MRFCVRIQMKENEVLCKDRAERKGGLCKDRAERRKGFVLG